MFNKTINDCDQISDILLHEGFIVMILKHKFTVNYLQNVVQSDTCFGTITRKFGFRQKTDSKVSISEDNL